MLKKLYAIWSKRNSVSYVNYLRKNGAIIGTDTSFMNSRNANVDSGRIKYLTIGSNCVICAGVTIIMHDYSWYVIANRYDELYPSGGMPVEIGDNVFVGTRSIILGGTCIGSNVVIGAGSVVKGNIESDSVYAGVPAKKIMSLNEYKEKLRNKLEDSAFSEVDYFLKKFNRFPSKFEMKNYSVLFSESEIQQNALGFSYGEYKRLLESTPSRYENYEMFLQHYSEEHQVNKA
jgi:Acetyltransferase (isoleucine patch superfamily)